MALILNVFSKAFTHFCINGIFKHRSKHVLKRDLFTCNPSYMPVLDRYYFACKLMLPPHAGVQSVLA